MSTPKLTRNLNYAAASLKNTTKFLSFPTNNNTPSPHMNRVVKNPFESHLTEHLYLKPVISSPSLFKHDTPKQKNIIDLFEWTIDEVSSLNPINLIPHETQFKQEEDPVVEAKAQDAIKRFFTEHEIVPSPKDCTLRNQKIILKDDSHSNIMIINSTVFAGPADHKPVKKVKLCDSVTQTMLTFPPQLTPEMEEMLKKFNLFQDDQQQDYQDEQIIDESKSMMDLSTLRRKLFINQPTTPSRSVISMDDSLAIHLSPPPKTPDLFSHKDKANSAQMYNKLNNSFDSDIFGELSPIMNFSRSSSCDISMISAKNATTEKTPSSRNTKRVEKKVFKRKNLSTSFCMALNEFGDNNSKENEEAITKTCGTDQSLFPRMDSGFNDCDIMSLNQSLDFMIE
ncbi:unnamed protein product [Diamesa serratosioi]